MKGAQSPTGGCGMAYSPGSCAYAKRCRRVSPAGGAGGGCPPVYFFFPQEWGTKGVDPAQGGDCRAFSWLGSENGSQ